MDQSLTNCSGPRECNTYLKEQPKVCVTGHLLLQPLFRPRQLPQVRGVCQSEFSRRVKEDVPYPRNDLALLSLSNVHHLEQIAVAFTQVKDIAKNFFDKIVNTVFDNGGVRIS